MGMNGAENIIKYLESITAENVDITEALAAKEYFSYYHEGLIRRIDDPINSRLNYGFAENEGVSLERPTKMVHRSTQQLRAIMVDSMIAFVISTVI